MTIVIVRRADLSDCKDVFMWRNDDVTRQMARSSDVVLWEDHERWYESCLESECRMLLICECKGKVKHTKLGVVRFDFTDSARNSEVSINISPSMRGKGYARECLKNSISYMVNEKPMCKLVTADIKKINAVSKILFENVGFKLVSEDSQFWQYQLPFPGSLQ